MSVAWSEAEFSRLLKLTERMSRHLKGRLASEELLGVAYLAWERASASFDQTAGSAWETWVSNAVWREMIDEVRRQNHSKRKYQPVFVRLADDENLRDSTVIPVGTSLEDCLNCLAREDRRFLVLLAEGRTQSEVAAILGYSAAWASWMFARIKREIKERLHG